MKRMKILITGATGYIGSCLTEFLSKEGSNDIIPLCRKLPNHFMDWKDKFEVIECDVTLLNDLKKSIPKKIDIIIHLAAYNNVDTEQMPDKSLIVNGIGTRNMLEIARDRGCRTFIYFSTLQVYGKELEGNYSIETPVNCFDDYALTHYIAEEYCKMFSRRYNLNVNVVRPSNGFGCLVHPKIDRWTLVPACFCLSAYERNEIRLKSSGKQNRDFISLRFMIRCIEYLIENEQRGFNIYNITSESLFSIFEIAKMVQSCGKSILNKDIDLICENKNPSHLNKFFVKNNLLTPPNREEIHNNLYKEIEKIFELLKTDRGD